MKKIIVTTVVGGMLFMIPLVFVTLIFGKAFQIMTVIAKPIDKLLPVDHIGGVALVDFLALLIMLLLCLITGLIAKGPRAQSLYKKSDSILGELVPSYLWTKTVMTNLSGNVDTEQFKPVLVRLDDQLQIAFEMERGLDNLVVVFFPGAPDVRSGTVAYITADRVEPLATSLLAINKTLKHMGKGAAVLLPEKQ